MGGEDSKASESQDDYFLLEHLSKMSLKNRKTVSYYIISNEKTTIAPILSFLRQYFKVDIFPSVATLKQQMSFVHRFEVVKVIITSQLPPADSDYLMQEPKITQIINYGSSVKGSKVAGDASSPEQLLQLLNALQDKDSLQIAENNVLFLIDQDTKNLNKYRLSYHCNTHFANRAAAKEDLIKLARKFYPQEAASIEQFEREYDISLTGQQKRKMVLEWVFKDCFFWNLVNTLTKNTTDPKRLAYIRLALKDIYESIAEQYRANQIYDSFFIIVDLNEEEKAKLEKSPRNFMLFSSFVKGMLSEKEANAELKRRPNAFQFRVIVYRSEKEESLDFGFVKGGKGPYNVVMNIYNVMRVEEINLKIRRGEIIYGQLPILNKKRQSEQARGEMSKIELDLTRNYDFVEDLMSKIDGQATLLQMSGYYKDSLQIYNKKVDFIRKTNESEQTMNRCLIRKADALALNGDFPAAQQEYQAVTTKVPKFRAISLIHLAEMYLRSGEEAKFDTTINQIEPLLSSLENQPKEKEEYYKGKHFIAIKTLKKGSYKKAVTLLNDLLKNTSATYQFTLEGRPLVHDIYRSLATVQSKLGHHNDALSTLNTTLSLQLACEGKTHNVALTQTLIQSVCRSSGNKEQLTKSLQRLQGMSTEIDSYQSRLSSSAAVNLNETMVNVLL